MDGEGCVERAKMRRDPAAREVRLRSSGVSSPASPRAEESVEEETAGAVVTQQPHAVAVAT